MATYVTPLPGAGLNSGPTGPKPALRMVNRSPSLLRNGSCNLKSNAAKRKSAVELLQESKAFYVKSEQVLDSKQELKHSEHLQVTANPNFDVLLKTPVRVVHSWECHGQSHGQVCRKAEPISTRLQNGSSCHEHHQDHANFNNVMHHQSIPASGVTNQVPLRPLQPVVDSTKGTQAPGLPPKSPRSLRPRSKTQPESSSVVVGAGALYQCHQGQRPEYRRSHSERDTSDDFQIRLRRLLNTDSKENLDTVSPLPPKMSPAVEAPTPRTTATCIHKSMPDLSPLKLRQNCRRPQGSTSTASTSSSASAQEPCTAPEVSSPVIQIPPQVTQITPSCSSRVISSSWALDGNRNSVRRPILRSKSDISHRYSKSGPDLTQCGAPRCSRSLADLERFFDTMGLDGGAFYQLHAGPSDASPPVFFNSVSSLSSSCCRAGAISEEESAVASPQSHGNVGGELTVKEGLTNENLSHHGPVETSIVERNARVIKWLYNCRKAS